jgi:hypothetical protein
MRIRFWSRNIKERDRFENCKEHVGFFKAAVFWPDLHGSLCIIMLITKYSGLTECKLIEARH